MHWKRAPIGVLGIVVLCAVLAVSCATGKKPTPAAGPKAAAPFAHHIKLQYKVATSESEEQLGYLGSTGFELTRRPNAKLTAEPTYMSKRPLYGEAHLGEGKGASYVFALDESRGTGTGYDTVYFDSNHNKDLTDDTKIAGTIEPPEKGRQLRFPPVEAKVAYGKRTLPYHMKVSMYPGNNNYAQLSSAGYCEGKLTLGGKKHRVILVDATVNGMFNDVYMVPKDYGRTGQIYGRGDSLMIDANGDGKFEKSSNTSSERLNLGKDIVFDKRCYDFDVAPDGRSVGLRKTRSECGQIVASQKNLWVELLGKDGAVQVTADEAEVPTGDYQIAQCGFEGTDKDGQLWRIRGRGQWRQTPVKVEAKKTTTITAGLPLTASVTSAVANPGEYRLSLAIEGKGGESYSANDFEQVGVKDRPAPPGFKILAKDGSVVAQGQFEYG